MDQITVKNIELFNQNLRYEDPQEIISFVLQFSKKPVLTTSFGPYSAALLHAVTQVKPDIKVIWCDTGYNTDATYQHANRLMELFELNIDIFTPEYTTAYLNNTIGKPVVGNPKHRLFSQKVKLEPFKRAIKKHKPDLWFANVRKGQTDYRDSLDILSFTKGGVLKVSPFYYYDNKTLQEYIKNFELPSECDYFDPVKALENRECGIHLRN